MPGTNKVFYSTCTLYFPAPFPAAEGLYYSVHVCLTVSRGAYSETCCSAWLSGRKVNLMSVPDLSVLGQEKIFPLYVAACMAG